jgi:hypothetical protein
MESIESNSRAITGAEFASIYVKIEALERFEVSGEVIGGDEVEEVGLTADRVGVRGLQFSA